MKYSHLPNRDSYESVRIFADRVLKSVRAGQIVSVNSGFGFDAIWGALPQVAFTKLAISEHHIDKSTCINCGMCVKKCPAGSVDLETGSVDHDFCIACFGCINNCPTGAMKMKFADRDVWGFQELLKRNNTKIPESSKILES